jgi:hypothetical protein
VLVACAKLLPKPPTPVVAWPDRQVLIDLNDLQIRLGNLGFGLRYGRNELRSLALNPGGFALQGDQLGKRPSLVVLELSPGKFRGKKQGLTCSATRPI